MSCAEHVPGLGTLQLFFLFIIGALNRQFVGTQSLTGCDTQEPWQPPKTAPCTRSPQHTNASAQQRIACRPEQHLAQRHRRSTGASTAGCVMGVVLRRLQTGWTVCCPCHNGQGGAGTSARKGGCPTADAGRGALCATKVKCTCLLHGIVSLTHTNSKHQKNCHAAVLSATCHTLLPPALVCTSHSRALTVTLTPA